MRRGLTTLSALAFTLGAVCVASALRWLDRPVATVASVAPGRASAKPEPYVWDIPAPFPRPPVPADNPMTAAKVLLGRHLFYDARLSGNGRLTCAACHTPSLGFADGREQAIGSTGDVHPRSSMSLTNVAYNPAYNWADPTTTTLEAQVLVPLFGTAPVEMGHAADGAELLQRLKTDPRYRPLFTDAFPDDTAAISVRNVARALASFQRTLISVRSPYDRYRYGGDRSAISDAAKRGEVIFFSGQRGGCFQCHGGWNFSGGIRHERDTLTQAAFFNTGLYNLPGGTSYPSPNTGLHVHTGLPGDVGRFRAPTLRNIAETAPYMHDGSLATLEDVIDHYAAGGRTIAQGPRAGVGHDNPNKAPAVHGFELRGTDRADLVAFLQSLTDSTFLGNRAFSDPWRGRR
jgi:cytochrome c peroxidase